MVLSESPSMPLVTLTSVASAPSAGPIGVIAARAKRDGTAITTVSLALATSAHRSLSSIDSGNATPGR